ncbi:MAG: MYXO-CTERM sorting domain-containing protein [Polyangiaceae bacterium]
MKWFWSALALSVASAVPSVSLARDFRVSEIPNGSHFQCQNCHNDNSGKDFTPFGSDAKSHLVPGDGGVSSERVLWDDAWCHRDSDGDGRSNGEELGDPDCTWAEGDPNPAGMITNPGAAGDGMGCGNGAVDAGESCDGTKTHAFSCAELTLGKGLLGCTPDCAYDTSKCTGAPPTLPPSTSDDGCSTSTGTASGTGAFALVALAVLIASRRRK